MLCACLDQFLMLLISSSICFLVAACEVLRLILYLLCVCERLYRRDTLNTSTRRVFVLTDSESFVYDSLCDFVIFRRRSTTGYLHFIPAQQVIKSMTFSCDSGRPVAGSDEAEAAIVAEVLRLSCISPRDLTTQLHVLDHVESQGAHDLKLCQRATTHVGVHAVLRLLSDCEYPYPLLCLIGSMLLPQQMMNVACKCFSRNSKMWFGRQYSATKLGRRHINESDKHHLVVCEATIVCGMIFIGFCTWWLPHGTRTKDGIIQQLARITGAAFILLLFASNFWPQGIDDKTTIFFERYVGTASARSLAAMRASCSALLLIFTWDNMTAPLAATAQVPRWMCRPSGFMRLLNEYGALGNLFDDERALWWLEQLTRAVLGCVALGLGTSITAPCAAILWLFYGGVLRAYNTWRGHSFIAAWWALFVIAWRGGAADVASVDVLLRASYEEIQRTPATRERPSSAAAGSSMKRSRTQLSQPSASPLRTDEMARGVDRGWTRFLVTLIFANNYFMAGLSKLCASGIAWASSENLKAKLLQTTLTQTSFGCYLTLFCRRLPDAFFGLLGACGLFGEVAMGFVPFCSFAKLVFPVAMWAMHVSIAALQHIVFIDLLFFIPAWYLWHALDHGSVMRGLEGYGVWRRWDLGEWANDIHRSWQDVIACGCLQRRTSLSQVKATKSDQRLSHLVSSDELIDSISLNEDDSVVYKGTVRAGAKQTVSFMLVFLGVWARGAEWFPYNAFRMFANWTPRPIFYERYVALDIDGSRLRNFHYHEISPVLNRKRLMEALHRCSDRPDAVDCVDFLNFVVPRCAEMRGRPAALVVQTRSWDYAADIDKRNYCDIMKVKALDIRERVVTERIDLPCDDLDLRACCASTLGTL